MNLEAAFLTCLKEIEVKYVTLPKPIRLRVERWVEKLVIVGQNIIWKKHRNMYTRLLLGMILSKNFTYPFDVPPPEGPLPPFPSHLKIKLKDVSGLHESTFWRDIYHRIPTELSFHQKPTPLYTCFEEDWRFDMGLNEIESLRQLIDEQSRRIEILEDQISTERRAHESEILRFMEHHRGEIETLRKKSESCNVDHHHKANLSLTASNGNSLNLPHSPSTQGPLRSFQTVRNQPSFHEQDQEAKDIPEDDHEFLQYLEEFQSHLKSFC